MCAGFSFKKTSTVSLSIDVRITMIRCVVHLLRIFEMFHGLMNNPVYLYVCGDFSLYDSLTPHLCFYHSVFYFSLSLPDVMIV